MMGRLGAEIERRRRRPVGWCRGKDNDGDVETNCSSYDQPIKASSP